METEVNNQIENYNGKTMTSLVILSTAIQVLFGFNIYTLSSCFTHAGTSVLKYFYLKLRFYSLHILYKQQLDILHLRYQCCGPNLLYKLSESMSTSFNMANNADYSKYVHSEFVPFSCCKSETNQYCAYFDPDNKFNYIQVHQTDTINVDCRFKLKQNIRELDKEYMKLYIIRIICEVAFSLLIRSVNSAYVSYHEFGHDPSVMTFPIKAVLSYIVIIQVFTTFFLNLEGHHEA